MEIGVAGNDFIVAPFDAALDYIEAVITARSRQIFCEWDGQSIDTASYVWSA
jgi:hypothetical protein